MKRGSACVLRSKSQVKSFTFNKVMLMKKCKIFMIICLPFYSVLRIRIRSDPYNFPGSRSVSGCSRIQIRSQVFQDLDLDP
jgi:hypothetical protein